MTKRSSVTSAASFKSALRTVKADLKGLGFWSKKLADINVRQTLWGLAYGWQYYRGSGDIVIPKLSIIRWFNTACYGDTFPVRDVIRHEYGHAVADCHRGIIRSAKFRDAFGMSHDDDSSSEYDDEDFVTYYASDNAGEDFAETFMYYVKHKGRIPANLDTPTIKKKWEFIKHVGCCLEEAV